MSLVKQLSDACRADSTARRIALLVSFVFMVLAASASPGMVRSASAYQSTVTLVLGSPSLLTVYAFRPSGPGGIAGLRPVKVVTVRSRERLREVVRLLDDMPPAATAVPCPADNGSRDVLKFRYSDGDRWTVVVRLSGCRSAYSHGATGAAVDPSLVSELRTIVGL
jgi:hypothetical protein